MTSDDRKMTVFFVRVSVGTEDNRYKINVQRNHLATVRRGGNVQITYRCRQINSEMLVQEQYVTPINIFENDNEWNMNKAGCDQINI